MKYTMMLCFALAAAPVAALAQGAPPPGPADAGTPSPQMEAAMRQTHAQLEQIHAQSRARMLAAMTPAHRALLANTVGTLALSATPNIRAAANQLDAALAPAEKQSIITIDSAEHQSAHALMDQQRTAFEATLSADQRAQMAQREATMQAFRQSHPRPVRVPDAGMIVLHTLAGLGGHEHGFDHGGPGMRGA